MIFGLIDFFLRCRRYERLIMFLSFSVQIVGLESPLYSYFPLFVRGVHRLFLLFSTGIDTRKNSGGTRHNWMIRLFWQALFLKNPLNKFTGRLSILSPLTRCLYAKEYFRLYLILFILLSSKCIFAKIHTRK